MEFLGDVISMCRGSLFQKENSLFPHESQSKRRCRLMHKSLRFMNMKLPQINRSCKKILTYFPCRITLQCIKIIIKWQELYFINTEPWALYIARNARLKSWSIVRKSKLKWVSIKESIEHFDLSMREHKIFFFKKKAILHLF